MQSSKTQPVKSQPLTPNIVNIPSPNNDHTADSSPPQTSQYPDVSQFAFLPDLYLIISRLAPLRNATSSEGLSQTISHDSQTSSTSLRHVSSSTSSAETSIEIKDLPAHVYAVKQGIARAKELVATLPDIERSVDMQEAEMRLLQRKIAGLKGRLGELGHLARAGGEG